MILILEVVLDVVLDVVSSVQNVILTIWNVILCVFNTILNGTLDILILPRIKLIEVICCFYNCSISATATSSVTYRTAYAGGATVFDCAVGLTDAVGYALAVADTVADTDTSASATGVAVAF
jgi:hypothetical protein